MVLASDLPGERVMTTDGVEIGTLENVTMDVDTGAPERFLVRPNGRHSVEYERNDDGQLLVPAEQFEARDEYILVRPPE